MKRRIFSVLFALVLACSLGLVTAVPVAAQAETLYVIPFTVNDDGAIGVATWDTTQQHSGSSSVKLVNTDITDANDFAEVYFGVNIALEDIVLATTSFWCKSTAGDYIPYFIFEIPGTFTEDAVLLRIGNDAEPSTNFVDVWHEFVASESSSPLWQWEELDADWNVEDSGWDTWDDLVTKYGEGVVNCVVVTLSAITLATGDHTAYVDDVTISGTTYDLEGTAADYTTIQSAITAAETGDTISVAAGTYNENLVVGVEDLTLESSSATAATIINAADASDYVVKMTTDNVTLDGFTITGRANMGENQAAVITWGVDYCTITNNILTDNYKDAINLYSVSGAYSDYNTVSNNVINGPAGIDTFGIKIKGSHNTISGNHVYNADTPILIWSYSDTETASPDYNTISGNTIGKGADTAAYKWGITLKTGHHNQVTGNTITDAERAAIYLYTSDRMETEGDFDPRPASDNISGNIITGGKVGIALMEGANTNTVSGNSITGTTVAGILGSLSRWPEDFANSPSSYLVGAPEAYLQIVGNTISGNTITNCGHGIAMEYADTNTLTGNTIQSNTSVVDIDWHSVAFSAGTAGVYFDANSSGNVAHYNNIAGNTGGLESGASLDAEDNWWGNASGPIRAGTAYTSYGDTVSANVDYEPWLLEVVDIEEVASGILPETYDKTLALKDNWTLVSTDKEVTANTTWVGTTALSDSATILPIKYTPADGYTQVTLATQLTSVDAYYLKTDGGGGVGIDYSTGAPGVVTKSLLAGWNIISCAGETDAYELLSPLRYVQIGDQEGTGLTSLVGQASYNQYLATTISETLVTTAEWTTIDTTPVTLNAFDGYWVYMNAAKSFGVIPE